MKPWLTLGLLVFSLAGLLASFFFSCSPDNMLNRSLDEVSFLGGAFLVFASIFFAKPPKIIKMNQLLRQIPVADLREIAHLSGLEVKTLFS